MENIPKAVAAITAAHSALEQEFQIPLKDIHVQWALTERLGIESGHARTLAELVEHCPDAETIIQLVRDFPFENFHSEKLTSVELEEDIIPSDIPRLLREQRIRLNGNVWTIHRNDADPFPSNPHAHNYAEGLKLDLSNGVLYDYRCVAGRIKYKHLLTLRERIQHLDLPPLETKE